MTISVGKVGMIKLDSIIVDDRAREVMGDLDELESNMRETGLIAPLAVMDSGNETYRLLAGERRFTVLKRNNIGEVPARIFTDELSDLEMKVIEKSENFHRKDMEWYELDKLTMEITKLQQSLKGVKTPGPTSSGWGQSDTAEIMGMSKQAASDAIKRAELREQFPELFSHCKTASDATNVIKKMNETITREEIAKQIESKSGDVNVQKLASAFIIKDFFEGVRQIEDGIFHMVEIDPPYGINLHEAKKKESESQYVLEDYNEVDRSIYMDGDGQGWLGLRTVIKECYRVMAQHGWLICWFGPEPWFEEIYRAIIAAGFSTTRLCGIWTKHTGQTKRPECRLANTYEMFFYAWKGEPALNKPGKGNTFDCSPVPSQSKVHPTERPVELMRELYDTFAFPGSRVLIPFLGSGNGLLAAHMLGMSAMGFEKSKGYKDSFLVKAHNLLTK